MVDLKFEKEWDEWSNLLEDDERSWETPEFAKEVEGERITFTDPLENYSNGEGVEDIFEHIKDLLKLGNILSADTMKSSPLLHRSSDKDGRRIWHGGLYISCDRKKISS